MLRCFVGLRLTEEAVTHLARLRDRLARVPPHTAAKKLKLTPTENLHATLKFLGATTDDDLARLQPALAAVASRHRRFEATLAGAGAFPDPKKPRAIFAAVGRGREQVVALAEDIERVARELGFPPEERPRVPHVTVARVEGAKAGGPLEQIILAEAAAVYGALDTRAVVLFESRTGGEHSRYVPICELSLAP